MDVVHAGHIFLAASVGVRDASGAEDAILGDGGRVVETPLTALNSVADSPQLDAATPAALQAIGETWECTANAHDAIAAAAAAILQQDSSVDTDFHGELVLVLHFGAPLQSAYTGVVCGLDWSVVDNTTRAVPSDPLRKALAQVEAARTVGHTCTSQQQVWEDSVDASESDSDFLTGVSSYDDDDDEDDDGSTRGDAKDEAGTTVCGVTPCAYGHNLSSLESVRLSDAALKLRALAGIALVAGSASGARQVIVAAIDGRDSLSAVVDTAADIASFRSTAVGSGRVVRVLRVGDVIASVGNVAVSTNGLSSGGK
tara:strand:- start:1228 stop:2166 length:939 start_codon:yes stop_codon:yes gene_type:complete